MDLTKMFFLPVVASSHGQEVDMVIYLTHILMAVASTATASVFQAFVSDVGATAGTTIALLDDSLFAGVDSTDTFANQVAAFISALGSTMTTFAGSFAADDKILFVVDDTNLLPDVSLWHWDDAAGNSDGVIDAGEITDVGTLDNTIISTLISDNFIPPA